MFCSGMIQTTSTDKHCNYSHEYYDNILHHFILYLKIKQPFLLTLFISLLLSFNNTKVRHFPLPGKLSKLYFSCHKVKYMLGLKKKILSFIIINQVGFPHTVKGLTGISR